MNKIYDVAVVGAGPGGSAAAHYMAKADLDVLLLDKSDFPRDKTCGDGLTPRALHILDDMGILDQANNMGYRINGLELHARSGIHLEAPIPEHDVFPNHLLIVPRLQLDNLIRNRAIKSGAHFESPVLIREIDHHEKFVRLIAKKNNKKISYRAKVIILAVGANLPLLRKLNILKHQPKIILAARAYFEGISGLNDNVQAHLADVPLPGYGWIFPISKTAANIGLGYWASNMPFTNKPSSIRSEMKSFLKGSKLRPMLKNARMLGPIQSYPLRVDFNSAPTYGDRILLVGESAGLVSPLTGEGIDFALESGRLAAKFIIKKSPSNHFSRQTLVEYDTLLRKEFQSIFRFLNLVRNFYINPILVQRTIAVSEKRSEIRRILINVLIGQQHPSDFMSLQVIRRVLLGT